MIAVDNGFHEAVALVADLESAAARLCAGLGYRVRDRGDVDRAALALLDLPDRWAREVVLAHPRSERGWLRLVQLDGAPAGVRRDGAQVWDCGGMFGVNVRSLGAIDDLKHALTLVGFSAYSPIVDFEFGPVAVREVLMHDADGLAIGLVERVRPPLEGFDELGGPASWAFNTTQTVPDFDAARRFYRDILGWKTVQETVLKHEGGHNLMGLPIGLAPRIPVQIGIYQAQGRMEGCVEIAGFGCRGLDFSAAPADARGWACLRIPVSDLKDFVNRATGGGCRVLGPALAGWRPYGTVRAAAIVTTWGVRIEAFQVA